MNNGKARSQRIPPTGRQGGTEKKTNKHVSSTGREALTGMSVESERERERCLETHGIKSKQFLVCKSHNLHR